MVKLLREIFFIFLFKIIPWGWVKKVTTNLKTLKVIFLINTFQKIKYKSGLIFHKISLMKFQIRRRRSLTGSKKKKE